MCIGESTSSDGGWSIFDVDEALFRRAESRQMLAIFRVTTAEVLPCQDVYTRPHVLGTLAAGQLL